MPSEEKRRQEISDQLALSIADDVGNTHEDELELISDTFSDALSSALKSFNSDTFDDDGFIKKMRDLELDDKKDKDMIKNVLNNVAMDYVNIESLNQAEFLLRRDIKNICDQMPEMRQAIFILRDAIIECDVATGEVSRSITFENHETDESLSILVKEIEDQYELPLSTKNFIVVNVLQAGETNIQVTPYSKLFAEIELMKDQRTLKYKQSNSVFRESIPNYLSEQITKSTNRSLLNDDNLSAIMECVSPITKVDTSDTKHIEDDSMKTRMMDRNKMLKNDMTELLSSIEVHDGTSIMMAEMGYDGFKEFIFNEYSKSMSKTKAKSDPLTHFSESINFDNINNSDTEFNRIDQDDIDTKNYKDIKGAYLKYLDPLKMVPIKMDRRIIGYLYASTTMDIQNNISQPNGVVDLSFQHYMRDKNMVDNLANMIIRSFDRGMLNKNIKLKNEIAEIIMAHKFSEGRLSFIYIPENEVVRIVIDEDENGRGHSIVEPSLFPARMCLMSTLYNMLYMLNNNTVRVHYLRSSGLDKNYAAQIQRTMRKFQSRRITIDDIYSYSGVLNKIGGMGEMVLPSGRNDTKALETDTIEAVQNPINIEWIEMHRRQALSATPVPYLVASNMIDEVDFAKTMELANTRFLSSVSGFKIDINRGMTKLYQLLLKYNSDLDDDIIKSLRYQFNAVKQQELQITTDMINNFNSLVETVGSIYYKKTDLEDDKGAPTPTMINLRKELAREYLPIDIDKLDEVIKRVDIAATDDSLQQKVSDLSIDKNDIEEVTD